MAERSEAKTPGAASVDAWCLTADIEKPSEPKPGGWGSVEDAEADGEHDGDHQAVEEEGHATLP